jgi:hypothetical protein
MLDAGPIFIALRDHASELGVFDHVEGHALINPPNSGVGVAFEFGTLAPGAQFSGLKSTSAVLNVTASIYALMQTQPADDIELTIVTAAAALINAYSGGFTLGGLIRNIDLLGMAGQGLTCRGGYRKAGDTLFRTAIVDIPMVVSDVFEQAG